MTSRNDVKDGVNYDADVTLGTTKVLIHPPRLLTD